MPDRQTVTIVPLFPANAGEVGSAVKPLLESAITGRGPDSNAELSAIEFLRVLRDIARIHKPTADAIAHVLGASLMAHHYEVDHYNTTAGELYFTDARAVEWGNSSRNVTDIQILTQQRLPDNIRSHAGMPVIEPRDDNETSVVLSAIQRVETQSHKNAFFVGDQSKLSSETIASIGEKRIIWTPIEVLRHFVNEHPRARSFTKEESWTLDALAAVIGS